MQKVPGDAREKIHPVMRYSPTISLFSAQPELRGQPYSFAVSVLAHGVTLGLLCLGILSAPKMKTPSLAEQYAVRRLDLHTLDSEMQREAANGVKSLREHSDSSKPAPTNGEAARSELLQQIARVPHGAQTLVQPDIPKPLTLAVEIPVPTVVIWNGPKATVKTIVAPMPEKPAVADVKPSIQLPTSALKLADIGIKPAELAAHTQLVLPSTTSPLIISGPKPTAPAPITTAAGSAQPTRGTVLSLSDKSMANGVVSLPPINESASSSSRRMGAGHGSGETGDSSGIAGTGLGANPGFGQGSQLSATHIQREKEGRFGAVVVGSSLEEKYPETAELWSGRMAYTVYLPVGLAKSWILQFSLSRADSAAAAGNITHIDAPWPYSIVRPNIAPGVIDADALMIHGIVNQAGHLSSWPLSFRQASRRQSSC